MATVIKYNKKCFRFIGEDNKVAIMTELQWIKSLYIDEGKKDSDFYCMACHRRLVKDSEKVWFLDGYKIGKKYDLIWCERCLKY